MQNQHNCPSTPLIEVCLYALATVWPKPTVHPCAGWANQSLPTFDCAYHVFDTTIGTEMTDQCWYFESPLVYLNDWKNIFDPHRLFAFDAISSNAELSLIKEDSHMQYMYVTLVTGALHCLWCTHPRVTFIHNNLPLNHPCRGVGHTIWRVH